MYLLAAFLPGIAIFLSELLYFTLFSQDLDLTARNLVAQYGQCGAPESLLLTPRTVILVGLSLPRLLSCPVERLETRFARLESAHLFVHCLHYPNEHLRGPLDLLHPERT